MSKTIKFSVYHPGERAAGIYSFNDTVTVTIGSGDAGGNAGEFESLMIDVLSQWFDANVTLIEQEPPK